MYKLGLSGVGCAGLTAAGYDATGSPTAVFDLYDRPRLMTTSLPLSAGAPTHRFRPGSPRGALSHRAFRWVFLGSFASNIGTWMQNVTLAVVANRLTHQATFVGLVVFAQLGPTLFLAPLGGVVADRVNRKTIMICAATAQTTFSLALAFVAHGDNPSRAGLVLIVAGIGISGAFYAPAANATLPELVDRADLAGAVSLNSFAMNASRVIGPLLATLFGGASMAWLVFSINGATYLFVIAAVLVVDFSGAPPVHVGEGRRPGFVHGLRAVHADRVTERLLVTVALYSLCSLIFIYQMPVLAQDNLGITDRAYQFLFGTFGLGAAVGAIAVGTVLANLPRPRVARVSLAAFAVSLAIFGLIRSPKLAFPVAFTTGFTYFVVITTMSTILQQRVSDSMRGRVMGLWQMGWAGLVPVGSLVAGPIIDAHGVTPVIMGGAIAAAALVFYADFEPRDT